MEARSRRTDSRRERDLFRWTRLLADEVGPRRPTGPAERRAAALVREELRGDGLDVRLEPFEGYSTFAAPFAIGGALAIAPALLPRRRRLARSLLAATGAAVVLTEGSLTRTPVSDALSRRPSQNLVATIEPSGRTERTVCLVSHLDTSRSGLLFHPALLPHLQPLLGAFGAAIALQGAEPVLGASRVGRRLLGLARAGIALGLGLLAERELRGSDVPGANDNASGVAVVAELALELIESPLERTRIVALMCGCEESGMLGAEAFLRGHDTDGWLFLNFDGVGAPGRLHFLTREGVFGKLDADPGLLRVAAELSRRRPELGLSPNPGTIGLTYDVTRVLARGGRALTLVSADERGVIPNYHAPSDTTDNLDPEMLERGLAAGREMLAAIDCGEAD